MQRRSGVVTACKLDSRFVAACSSETQADSTPTRPQEEIDGSSESLFSWDPAHALPLLDDLLDNLHRCRKIKSPSLGLSVHSCICSYGLEPHPLLGNHLVPMLVDCGHLGLAQQVFSRLAKRNEFSWTALIQGLSEHGAVQDALGLFALMVESSVDLTAHSYVAVLKCCVELSCIQKGLTIHHGIIENGLDGKLYVGNVLLFMYAKYGCIMEAWKVFEDLPPRDKVSWSALIGGLIECGLCEEALTCYHQMQMEGMGQDGVIYIHCLNACSDMKLISQGRETHVEVAEQGLAKNLYVGNALLDMYMKCGSLVEAREVFDSLPIQDVVSCTALMLGYADYGFNKEVLICLDQMQSKGISPNKITYVCTLHACSMAGNTMKGLELHGDIVRKGYELDIPIGGYIVNLYSRCGFFLDAQKVFEKLTHKDLGAWNSLVRGYAEHGFADEAYGHFQRMQSEGISPDIVSWNSVIIGFAEWKQMDTTFNMFLQMQEQGLLPNNMTFVIILKACGDISSLMHGKRAHTHLYKTGVADIADINLTTALFDMYGRCGSMREAQLVFDELPLRDLVAWNALMTGYVHQGETDAVFFLFSKLQNSARPDTTTFLNVFSACNHMGCLQEGYQYFELMSNGYGLTPNIRHFNCMLDLHGRAGHLDDAMIVSEHMPFQPDLAMWNSVAVAIANSDSIYNGQRLFNVEAEEGRNLIS